MIIFSSVFPILLAVLLANYFKVCMSHKLDAICGVHTYKINKAMQKYFYPISKEIEVIDKEIASLKTILLANMNKKLELNEILKQKHIITETESLKNQISTKNTMRQILESQNISCQNNATNKDTELRKLKSKFDEFKDNTKYFPNGCNDRSLLIEVLKLNRLPPFFVRCDSQVAGPGWTVIQRRIDGTVNFDRDWNTYKYGFGDVRYEYFIGLENLHAMTNSTRHELYIKLVDQKNETRFARYDDFVIGSEIENYKLKSLGKYTGTAGNSMWWNIGNFFSTNDRDNADYHEVCPKLHGGAWWYSRCGHSNLNGKRFDCVLEDKNTHTTTCIFWATWHGRAYSMRNVQMMIRPFDYGSSKN